jgi:cytochrome c oxidase subunit I
LIISKEYEQEHGPIPLFKVSKQLSTLTLLFIISSITYFLIAGSLAIVMRIIQSKVNILGNEQLTLGLFYTSLTIHGQLMFFGFMSMLTIGISYYLLSKFSKKPLYSMKLAIWSFSLMNAGAIFLIISGTMFYSAGWYNLMPLPFHPGNNGWSSFAAAIFLIADVLIGIALVFFCINVLLTVLRGKIATGIQSTEQADDDIHKYISDKQDRGRIDLLPLRDIPPSVRWVSVLGISSWFPKKYRSAVPAVSIVVVGIFVNALVMLIGSMGLFTQLGIGFSYLTNPNFEPNWLFTKDAWWFFGHPIVYFTLFSFLGAAYYYIPKYSNKTVPYDKWAYRTWPFYFVFTTIVFSHHVFMDTPNPTWLQMLSQAASFGIVFPSGLTLMTIMMYIFRSRIKWNITSMFILCGIAGWAFGGFAGTQTGWWGTNVYLHNTLNIVGHIHLVLLMGSVLLALGLVYSILPSITGKTLGRKLGAMHLILTIIGGFGLAFLFLFLGFEGFIRREGDIPSQFAWAMPWLMFFALVVGFGQIVFAYNVFRNLKRKMKTNEELEFEEGQNERLRREQNLYINQAGEIMDISLSLKNKEGRIDNKVGAEEKEEIETKIGEQPEVYDRSLQHSHINLSNRSLYYAAAAFTALAGILHLVLVQYFIGFNSSTSTFFVIAGIAQIFWVLPIIRRWGRLWYVVGIVGSIALIALFLSVSYDWAFVEFYFATGIAQIFWVLPIIRRWGRLWYVVGIVGSIALIFSWNIINAPLPVKGIEAPYDDISIVIETLQVAFIAAMVSIIIRERQNKEISSRTIAG